MNYCVDLITLASVAAIAVSSTLAFWFSLQYLSSGEHHGSLVAFAFIALAASFYGITLLGNAVHEKTQDFLSRVFRLEPVAHADSEVEKKGS